MFGLEWRRLFKRTVMINLHSGKAFEGILFKKSGNLLTLKQATLYDPEAHDPVPMDGDVYIDRSDIEFIQLT